MQRRSIGERLFSTLLSFLRFHTGWTLSGHTVLDLIAAEQTNRGRDIDRSHSETAVSSQWPALIRQSLSLRN